MMKVTVVLGLAVGLLPAGACTESARQPVEPPSTDEPKLVTRRDPEPAGKNCPLGGTMVRAGRDRNGNGTLEDAEVEHTDYICDVPTTLLVRRDPLPASLDCPRGGEAVQSGIDDNANGTLEDGEIDQTTRVCSSLEVWDRDFGGFDWDDPIRVAALRGARVVLGSLQIKVTDPIELPLLEQVTGHLVLDTASAAIALPALRTVGGNLGVGTGSSLPDLPVLELVGGNMFVGARTKPLVLPRLGNIGGNLSFGPTSARVTFDVLGAIGGELFVSGDSSLLVAPNLRTIAGPLETWLDTSGTLSLPDLRTLGGEIQFMGPMTGLQLDRLESIGGGIRFNAFGLNDFALVLPSLQSIDGDVDAVVDPGVTAIEMPQLTDLRGELRLFSFPALTKLLLPAVQHVTGSIQILDTHLLTEVDLHSLVFVDGGIIIFNAPLLTTLQVRSLSRLGQLESFPNTSFQLSQTGVEVVDLGSLRTATAFLSFGGNPRLRAVQMPELTAATGIGVGGDGSIVDTVTAPKIETLATLNLVAPIHTLDLGRLTDAGFVAINGATAPNLDGLSSLTRVGALLLSHCPSLSDFRSLSRLSTLSALWLSDNGALVSLDGLERVTELAHYLRLERNQALTSVAGLGNVTHIGQQMFLQSNNALTTIELTHLRSIGGDFMSGGLFIWDMAALDTLSGLDALATVGGDIEIRRNDRLSDDEVRAFIQRIFDNR